MACPSTCCLTGASAPCTQRMTARSSSHKTSSRRHRTGANGLDGIVPGQFKMPINFASMVNPLLGDYVIQHDAFDGLCTLAGGCDGKTISEMVDSVQTYINATIAMTVFLILGFSSSIVGCILQSTCGGEGGPGDLFSVRSKGRGARLARLLRRLVPRG